MIDITLYGELVDLAGKSQLSLEDSHDTTDKVLASLESQFPGIKSKVFRIAVNNRVSSGQTGINPGDKIALMPPFAGG